MGTRSYLPTYLPLPLANILSQRDCQCRIRGWVGGECPVHKGGILGVFRPVQALKVSKPLRQCHAQGPREGGT